MYAVSPLAVVTTVSPFRKSTGREGSYLFWRGLHKSFVEMQENLLRINSNGESE